eukprot:2363653-Rhodomonas_salina.1
MWICAHVLLEVAREKHLERRAEPHAPPSRARPALFHAVPVVANPGRLVGLGVSRARTAPCRCSRRHALASALLALLREDGRLASDRMEAELRLGWGVCVAGRVMLKGRSIGHGDGLPQDLVGQYQTRRVGSKGR